MIIINYDVFTLYIPHHDHHYDDQESKEKKMRWIWMTLKQINDFGNDSDDDGE